MDPLAIGPRGAPLVRQYELLLMTQHRFVLSEVLDVLAAVARALQLAEQRLQQTQHSARASTDSRTAHAIPRAIASMLAQLRHLATHLPGFLSDTDLDAFRQALREFTCSAGLERFWELTMDASAREAVERLAQDVVCKLLRELPTLDAAIARALPTTTALRLKRTHLIEVIDASLAVVEGASASRAALQNARKAQRMEALKVALRDPSLQRAAQLDCDIRNIETAMETMLLPHVAACRPINAANAQVGRDAAFLHDDDMDQIRAFVDIALQVQEPAFRLDKVLHDAETFVRQLKLFEKAASKDAFVVCSSALKLNFHESLDDELFRAYVADWRDKRAERERVLSSNQFDEASHRVAQLKEEFVLAQASVHSTHNREALDEKCNATLVAQIADVFYEAGGNTSQMIPLMH